MSDDMMTDDGVNVPAPRPERDASDDDKPKQTEIVIQTVEAEADLFHDEKGDPYAMVRIGERPEAVPLRSRKFRTWTAYTFRKLHGHPVGSTSITEALTVLEGIAVSDRPQRDVSLRVAEHEGSIWLDLADAKGQAVEVTRDGWNIRSTTPAGVCFTRPSAMQPLPVPEPGGRAAELRPFLNVANDESFVLVLGWLVTALRPERPYPLLSIGGEQGVGKSTMSRMARSLVDPSKAPIRGTPQKEDDLFVAAVNAHVIAYDNLSGVPLWLSDALCRLATGGAIAKRALYTDHDETVLEAMRPIIVNGIDDIATRSDLADRCLLVTLEPIPPEARRPEDAVWAEFNAAAPRILGGILDGVVSAMARIDGVRLARLPRMADFARWATAAEPGLGLPDGAIMAAYERQRERAVDVALEASPVASAVRELLSDEKHGGKWEGTAGALLGDLNRITPEAQRHARGWPKQPNHLSAQLARAKTFLREVGVSVDTRSEGRGTERRKFLVLSTLPLSEKNNDRPHRPHAENMGRSSPPSIDPASPPDRPQSHGADGGADAGDGAGPITPSPNASDSADGGGGADGGDESGPDSFHAFSDLLSETGS